MPIKTNFRRAKHKLRRALSGAAPSYGDDALTIQAAKALTEHYSPNFLLPYHDFEDGYAVTDDGHRLQLGFGFGLSPAIVAGKDMEEQLETLISRAPDDAVIQFAMHSTPDIDFTIELWKERRLKYNKDPIIEEMVKRRMAHFKNASINSSLLPDQQQHPRDMKCYLFINIPYQKDPEHASEVATWRKQVDEYRDSVQGSLDSMGLWPSLLKEADVLALLRELCNPQIAPNKLKSTCPTQIKGKNFKDACFERQTKLTVRSNGDLLFADNDNKKIVIPITVDRYPSVLRLYMTGDLLGNMKSRTDRIAPPFWMYTTIHKPNPEALRDQMSFKLGLVSKQCLSNSEWYKSMVPHIFQRRNETQEFLENTRGKLVGVRMFTGINIFSTPERAIVDAEYLTGLWKKTEFKATRETNISLPVWQASLPWAYNPRIDLPTEGMQRAQPLTSLNAATAAIVQSDWGGNVPIMKKDDDGTSYPYANGLLLLSRRGQLACIDIFESPTNYNFAVIATSGAGKSFFANEIVSDIRGRGGMVRIIDAGGSYKDLVALMGGTEIRFDPLNPRSLNPFWGMSKQDLAEMMPLLKDVVSQMAFPKDEPSNYEYQLVEKAIFETHANIGLKMELTDIKNWFESQSEKGEIYANLAVQLEPYASGRLGSWFNGEPKLDLSNPVTLLELDELNNDPDLRTVVLTLLMAQTTRDMYLGDRSLPKLMLTDEAWDLFSDPRPAKVIETAFRRIRKYFGAAGFITQGFADTDMSEAAIAAIAAYASSSWRFILKQTPESLAYGQLHKKLGEDDGMIYDLISTVSPGNGFSELYVQHETGSGLFRFITDKYSYLTYSSKAQDITNLEKIQKDRGIDLAQALALYADGELERD